MKAFRCDICNKYYDSDSDQYKREWQPNEGNMNITWDKREKTMSARIIIEDSESDTNLNICNDCICQIIHDQFIVDWQNGK